MDRTSQADAGHFLPGPIILRWLWLACVAVGAGVPGVSAEEDGASAGEAFRIAFTSTTFVDVNENDAKATLKALGDTVAREHGVPVRPRVEVFQEAGQLAAALRAGTVDALAVPVTELPVVRSEIRDAPILTTQLTGRDWDRYVVLVRADRGYAAMEGLRGRRLLLHRGPRSCLAEPWLSVTLSEGGLPVAPKFFQAVEWEPKLSRVVLPVFFGKADACVVTWAGFETMKELNPQMERQMRVLAGSGPLITFVLAFRSDYAPEYFDRLEKAFVSLHDSVKGRQLLTIFQTERLESRTLAVVEPALDLLRRHRELRERGVAEPGGLAPGRDAP